VKETAVIIGLIVVTLAIGIIVAVQNAGEYVPEVTDYTTLFESVINAQKAMVDDLEELKRDVATIERESRGTDISGLESKLGSLATAVSNVQSALNLQGQKIASIDTKVTEDARDTDRDGNDRLTVRLPTSNLDVGDDLEIDGECGARDRIDVELEHKTIRTGDYRFTDSTTADANGDWDINLDTDRDMPEGDYILTIECGNDERIYRIDVN